MKVLNEIFDLFVSLDASDEQLDFLFFMPPVRMAGVVIREYLIIEKELDLCLT